MLIDVFISFGVPEVRLWVRWAGWENIWHIYGINGAAVPSVLEDGKSRPDVGKLVNDVGWVVHGGDGVTVYIGSETCNGFILLLDG